MSVDEDIRALERAVIAGDETQRPRLEALYARTGAGAALEERLLGHVGPWRPCRDCNGMGSRQWLVPVETGAEHSRVVRGPCSACDGAGRVGPLRFARVTLAANYANMLGPEDSRRPAWVDRLRCGAAWGSGPHEDGKRGFCASCRKEQSTRKDCP